MSIFYNTPAHYLLIDKKQKTPLNYKRCFNKLFKQILIFDDFFY